ncbi:hypothetical protein LAZ67_12002225, partial [Cordylochernes scorpioides]
MEAKDRLLERCRELACEYEEGGTPDMEHRDTTTIEEIQENDLEQMTTGDLTDKYENQSVYIAENMYFIEAMQQRSRREEVGKPREEGDEDPDKTIATKIITSGDVVSELPESTLEDSPVIQKSEECRQQEMIQTGCVAEEGELIASDNSCGTSVLYKIERTEGECPQATVSDCQGLLRRSNWTGRSWVLRGSATRLDGFDHPEVGAGDPTERDRALDALWKSDDNVCDAEVARNVSAPSSAMQAEKMFQECVPFIFVPSPDKVQIKQPPPRKSSTDLETATGSDTSRRFKKLTALCVVGTKKPRFEGFGKRAPLEQENGKPKEEKEGHYMDSVDQVDESTVKIGDLQPRRGRKRRKRNTNDHNPLYIAATECSHREFNLSDESILGSEICPPSCGELPPCARQRSQSMASALVESGNKAQVEMWFCKQGFELILQLRFREADDPHVARDVREIKGPPISASGEISLFGTKRIEKGAVKRCSKEVEEKKWASQEKKVCRSPFKEVLIDKFQRRGRQTESPAGAVVKKGAEIAAFLQGFFASIRHGSLEGEVCLPLPKDPALQFECLLDDDHSRLYICNDLSLFRELCDGRGNTALMVETRSGKMQDPAQERINAEESAKPQPGATIGRDASSEPVVLNPNIDIPKYDGTEDPRPWIESLEEIGFLYHWADYIISRYAAMNMIGSAKTWLNLHKISLTSWENFKSRLIEDFASDANKEEMKMRLNRMQQWNEPAIRLAEDILVLCNKVDPQMEEETKINWPAKVNLMEESEQKEHEEPQFQINENLSYKETEQLKQVLERYADLFTSGLGRSNLAKHRIDTEGAKPIKHKPYRVSAKEREIIKEQIDEMLRDGIIRPSSSPWSFPVILVKKRDSKYRFCVDYRNLNDVTMKDVYPIPRIDEVLDTLQGSKYFSAIDIKSGYWQVEVEEKDKEKTAFTTAHGLYEFNVMPFGLCNAPATFERNMENMLGNLRWQICLFYLDDVIIYSSDFSTHLKRIEAVLRCFREANLKLNNKKCQFAFEELEISGHITNQPGIKPAEHNIKAIRDFPRPKKIKEVQSFLGMCSYYRKFIKGFSKIADPLISLIKKNVPFTWTENQEKAFQTLKVALINPPILGHFDPNAITYIHTDASNIGLGTTLVQKFGDKEKVISYLSRTLSKPEQNYSTTEKECLAVVWSMSKLRPYLYGRHFKIVTDHHALCWLKNLKDPTGALARWALKIQEYNFEIIHKSGKKHLHADGLSRGPFPENEWDEDYESLFLNQIIDEKDDFLRILRRTLVQTSVQLHRTSKKKMGVSTRKIQILKTCHLCPSRKGSNHLPSGLLQPIPPANYPFERIGIDFVDPLPSTKRRRKWIIVLNDYYTKYAETKAVSEATVKVSTFLIEHIILRHGAPRFLISGRGSQFTSNLMKEVMKMCKVKHCFTTSYHPQTNGLTERLNRTLINMISMYVNTDQKNWDEILPFITHAYNTTIQETTGYSPFFLLFGREPMSLLDDENIPTDSNMDDYDEYIENYLDKIARTRQVVINNTEKTQERMKRNYDKKHNEKIYEPGHLVAVWTPVRKIGKCEKLLRKYFGPYRILKKLSSVNYLIEPKDNPGQDPLIVHVSRLKPYFERIDEVTHEDKYRERVEKSRNLYNGPRYSRPQQPIEGTCRRLPHETTRPLPGPKPLFPIITRTTPILPPDSIETTFPSPSTPRRPYNPNFVPKPNLQRNTYNKSQEVSKNRTEDGRPICFKCNKPGHVARYCRVKFIRILEEDPADTQEKVEEKCQMNEISEKSGPRLYADSAKDSIVPECSMKLIKALVETEDGEYIIEESSKMFQTNGLRLARSLINVINRETHIWITNPNRRSLKQVLERYGDLFSSRLGRTNLAKHRIDTEDAKPIKHKPYRVSAKERDIIKEQIDEMLTEGIIRPSSSPWSFPVILVKKRDGKYRFCVDYRKLNNVTVKDVYPIPRIDEVMDTLQGSTHFSAIDLRSGYWQVEVEERDKEKTAFTTAHGLYEFNVMPFGLCNAPATFERNMENMLGNLRWQICLCYLDDVIIYSPDFPTHLKRLEAVFRCFRESNLRLNDKKCRFAFEELEILGYIPSKHERQEEAFQALKTALLSPPILGHFNPNAPTYVHTDASNIGIGATLVQDIGGEEKVISYLSRTLSKAEQNYSTTEKECLAVVWSMSKLRPYLYGRHFKIVTDHHALCWLKNLKDPTGRLARWALKIQEYDFDIIHKSGKKHLDADGLSRGPLPETDWDEDFERLFLNQITDEEDKFIESVKKNLNGSRRSIAQNFKEEDGCLFKKNPNPEGRAWLLVVPENKKREIMKEYHNHMSNGHLGVARTMYRIK